MGDNHKNSDSRGRAPEDFWLTWPGNIKNLAQQAEIQEVLREEWDHIRPLLKGLTALPLLATAVGAGVGWLYTHPPRQAVDTGDYLAQWGIPYQQVTLQTKDGLDLAAWYTPGQNGAIILVAHGWGTGRLVEFHALFARHGYGVLSWDFRGHGQSQGEICSAGYFEALDAEAALEFALDQEPGARIGYWGGSMGGTAGLRLASYRPEVEALVLDSTPSAVHHAVLGIVKLRLLVPLVFRVAEGATGTKVAEIQPLLWIKQFSPRPVLIIQGTADNRLSAQCGQRFLEAGAPNASLWLVNGVKHLDLANDRPEEYDRRLMAFFAKALLNETI